MRLVAQDELLLDQPSLEHIADLAQLGVQIFGHHPHGALFRDGAPLGRDAPTLAGAAIFQVPALALAGRHTEAGMAALLGNELLTHRALSLRLLLLSRRALLRVVRSGTHRVELRVGRVDAAPTSLVVGVLWAEHQRRHIRVRLFG